MFQKIPASLGKALGGVRAGVDKLLLNEEGGQAPETIRVESPAFADGDAIPVRFTADGEGTSPPLSWSNLPEGTKQVLVVVEDPDIPAPQPFIHLIAVFDAAVTSVGEGGLKDGSSLARLGKHSMGGVGWLPNDPPPGHGPHHYLFQVFALNRVVDWDDKPGKDEVKTAIVKSVLAKGVLTGIYERVKPT
nr:YbhB/YbcL family Raf kinase inhibitor-like protein [uncultured Brevundimonas sp.]